MTTNNIVFLECTRYKDDAKLLINVADIAYISQSHHSDTFYIACKDVSRSQLVELPYKYKELVEAMRSIEGVQVI